MQVGETRLLYIPWQLGYGTQGSGAVDSTQGESDLFDYAAVDQLRGHFITLTRGLKRLLGLFLGAPVAFTPGQAAETDVDSEISSSRAALDPGRAGGGGCNGHRSIAWSLADRRRAATIRAGAA